MENWILKRARASAAGQVILWTLLLGGAAFWVYLERRYAYNFVRGPFDMDAAQLAAIGPLDSAPRYFVRVTPYRAVATGVQQVKATTGGGADTSREVTGEYYALLIGDRILVARISGNPPATLEGELARMPPDLKTSLTRDSTVRANWSRFYSFYLSDEDFRTEGYFGALTLLAIAFVTIKYGRSSIRHLRSPSSHPAARRASEWGAPIAVAADAKREYQSPRLKGGDWRVGNVYLVQSNLFKFNVLRVSDVLWGYKRVVKHYHTFIPTGKTYEAILHCYGGTATIGVREKQADLILAHIAERTPWAVYGFSEQLAKQFSRNTREFCLAVDQRRQEWVAAQQGKS